MSRIQLLVSVRNAIEAVAAADGGADIIDVKDPEQGSLGFAGWEVIQSIQRSINTSCTVSAALGELHEWKDHQGSLNPSELPALHFAKIGLAQQQQQLASPAIKLDSNSTHDHGDRPSEWITDWEFVRKQLPNVQQWVAVAYSDFQRCNAPEPRQVLDAAIATDCRILLLDTFLKDGRTTFDHLTESELRQLIQRSHSENIKVAIAGQVSANDVSRIQTLRPDIVAVRGAVCERQDRRKGIQQSQVVRLREALDSLSETVLRPDGLAPKR